MNPKEREITEAAKKDQPSDQPSEVVKAEIVDLAGVSVREIESIFQEHYAALTGESIN